MLALYVCPFGLECDMCLRVELCAVCVWMLVWGCESRIWESVLNVDVFERWCCV